MDDNKSIVCTAKPAEEIKHEHDETIQVKPECDFKLENEYRECSNETCGKIQTTSTINNYYNSVKNVNENIQLKIECDSEQENECRQSDRNKSLMDLYEDHIIIKEEFVSGPEVIQKTYNNATIDFIKKDVNNEEQLYQCDFCEKNYDRKIYLQHHIETKHMQLNYTTNKCEFCNKVFHKIFIRNLHMAHCPNNPNKTEIKKSFNTKCKETDQSTDLDYSSSTNEKKNTTGEIKCHLCKKEFRQKKGLYRHVKHYCAMNKTKTETTNPDRICNLCNRVFCDRKSRDRHFKYACSKNEMKISTEVLQCHHCKKVFHGNKINLNRHMKFRCPMNQNKVSEVVTCNLCKKEFINKLSLYRHRKYSCHIIKNKVSEEVSCHLCKKIVSNKYNLNKHWKHFCPMNSDKTKINIITETSTCHLCDKVFCNVNVRDRHLKLACPKNKDKTVYPDTVCELCNKVFSSKFSRDQHIKHACPKNKNKTVSLDTVCNLCNKVFSNKNVRDRHMNKSCPKSDNSLILGL